ncbi:arginyl-tRNA synthetase [Thermotoga maritima MSB8]|uniref:Arginine--tRNA ligase n=1 Tax=Thermotoga maritima (strain ATCC 43589 / DSM 3109 / JCM 10099 / NBRC 100826 / MSB8) TaxID=243274 RepID=SYR_THEMA|nr:arginine--tRNA ligase [Thermotoga maritima]Q9X0H8.1 RecName: Full=Arginine--tRNA ligase; AltName: Full=Arginyl-tRNA synthetase; Short=ArgRS [Thermotoga maritima MSB8]AAD36169.1 arginyl-tRNA synthetase [Thermotoga maritima MSB8]AGL50022.1 Arginyl-tRNA synthetase [Thermotoga maritima MSB8]AHD18998.1 arginyl-tRNA synthetase [Thermotoga maritima MSB8]AKE27004.1 arginyl-tRNA synthetase [Thermotoga maritima]AKE28869.1 arginyl-tRNA synthetase [Thermotoga maritima MSB8]
MLVNAIRQKVSEVISKAYGSEIEFEVEIPPRKEFGDLSTNVAMKLAKTLKKNPREIAQEIVKSLDEDPSFDRIEIMGPGFINFFLSNELLRGVVKTVLEKKDEYGRENVGNGMKVQFEYGSANPTGPFTVGHGRQIIIGDVLSEVYKELGYDVTREMYINDAGKQIRLLAQSLWARYNQLLGVEKEIPEGGYRGEYLVDIARDLVNEIGDRYKDLWNEEVEEFFKQTALNRILSSMKDTLEKIGSSFDVYFSEKSLIEDGTVEEVLKLLKNKDVVYEKDGAVWLKVSAFIDEEDKVLVRSDGTYTYFMTDIAYHYKKYKRGFRKVYDIWGSDHHGHIPRMKAAMKALDIPDDFFNVILHQFVTLKRGGEIVRMSTRAGEFVTLDELLDEVGRDATRYFFAMVDPNTHMVFDIDLAKAKSMDNPVYYVQYAHARIHNLFSNAEKKGVKFEEGKHLELLGNEEERVLMRNLGMFNTALKEVAQMFAPNRLTNYLQSLAESFHAFYTKHVIVDPENPELSNARLNLALATGIVLRKGLKLIGVSAPERM